MAELTVPTVDFSSLGQLPQLYRQGQANALRQQTLASLGQGGQADANALLRSGDLSLAQLGIAMRNREQDLARQATLDTRQAARDKVADAHWAATHELARQAAARAGEEKFGIKEVVDPNTGETSFVKYNTRTGDVLPTGAAAPPSTPNNPFSAGGKFNEGQGKAAGFTDRMLQSEGVLSGVGPGVGFDGPTMPGVQEQGTSVAQTGMSKVPGVGNFLVSGERQKYNQAKADFINAQLRRESGAAISPSEFANAEKQYFPVPGDKPENIRQKAANRRTAIEAMGREGGGSYKPKYNFDAAGVIQPYGSAPPAAARPGVPAPPKPGQLIDGYRYKGGDPADPASWVKQQ